MKGFFRNHWLVIGLVIICVGVAIYVLRELMHLPEDAVLEQLLLKEGVSLKQVHYSQGDIHKEINWKLDAKEVRLSEDNNIVSFHQFHLTVEPKNRPKVQLKGHNGEYSRVTGILRMWGDLQVNSDDGYSAKSEHLVFDENNGLLTTDDPVEISGPFFILTGKGLFVDLKKEILKIHSNVTTVLKGKLLIS